MEFILESCELFWKPSARGKNDATNKLREKIIVDIINNNIPKDYYHQNEKWQILHDNLNKWIVDLTQRQNLDYDPKYTIAKLKGGRSANHDIELTIGNCSKITTFKVEFKAGTTKINGAPQFYSPSNPNTYLSKSFSEYYYDNYMSIIAEKAGLTLPDKTVYLATIHGNKPICMKLFKDKYDNDPIFKKFCKIQAKSAINTFINNNNVKLDISKLSEKLLETQNEKHYLLCQLGQFYYDKLDESRYKITSVDHVTHNSFILSNEHGNYMKVLLRFKNGIGINWPAFQISNYRPKKTKV